MERILVSETKLEGNVLEEGLPSQVGHVYTIEIDHSGIRGWWPRVVRFPSPYSHFLNYYSLNMTRATKV